jgi:hypothetical protein
MKALGLKGLRETIFKSSSKSKLGTSNNYLGQMIIKKIFDETGRVIEETELEFKERKNADYQELILDYQNSGDMQEENQIPKKLRGAMVYGFKNI